MAFNSAFSAPITELPPAPVYNDSLISKFSGTWIGGFEIDSLIKYAKAVNKHNCMFDCCVNYCMPKGSLELITTIAPGPDPLDKNTFMITEKNAFGLAYTNKVTIGQELIMDTGFGKCKVLVTESIFDSSVKWRYEVLGVNQMSKAMNAKNGTVIFVTSRLDSYDSNKMIIVMEVNGEIIELKTEKKLN